MDTVELMEQAIAAAEKLGYGIRQEWLGGCGAGACEIAGRRWIFIDASLTIAEQLDQLIDALQFAPGGIELPVSSPLARRLGLRKSA